MSLVLLLHLPVLLLRLFGSADAVVQHDAVGVSHPHIQLSNGVDMPAVGFGTAGLGRGTAEVVEFALYWGFRHLDSAQAAEWYDETSVGHAVQLGRMPRQSLFLTSKLHPRDYAAQGNPVRKSMDAFGTDYVDLFLLHQADAKGMWRQAWRRLEAAYDAGHTRAIGVSNFQMQELEQLWKMARIKPHVVQNWMDPLHPDTVVRKWCQRADIGIAYVAFSSLGTQWNQGGGKNPVLQHPVLLRIATRARRSVAAVVLSWARALGVGVIPRSSHPEHTIDNARLLSEREVVQLTRREMAQISALSRYDEL